MGIYWETAVDEEGVLERREIVNGFLHLVEVDTIRLLVCRGSLVVVDTLSPDRGIELDPHVIRLDDPSPPSNDTGSAVLLMLLNDKGCVAS